MPHPQHESTTFFADTEFTSKRRKTYKEFFIGRMGELIPWQQLDDSFITTPANEHDLNQITELMHGDETFVSADSGCRGVEKHEGGKDKKSDWLIAQMPSKVWEWKSRSRINKFAVLFALRNLLLNDSFREILLSNGSQSKVA